MFYLASFAANPLFDDCELDLTPGEEIYLELWLNLSSFTACGGMIFMIWRFFLPLVNSY